MLEFRPMTKRGRKYALQLARDEINIVPRRLDEYRNCTIHHDGERIGFVSFGARADHTVYIYILAFEEHAQGQGFAAQVLERLMKYGQTRDGGFRGLSATIQKKNEPAIHATKKHGFMETEERKNHLDFLKPFPSMKEQ